MKKKMSILLTAFLVTSIFLTACGKKDDTATKGSTGTDSTKVLNLIETSEIPSTDSAKATDTVSFRVINNVMEGLYRLDGQNKPVPGMAQKVDISEDKTKYTFTLRDAKWSNGDSVTAKDFVYAWQRAANPATGAEYAFMMEYVKNGKQITKGEVPIDKLGVSAPDDKTLVVQLEQAVPYFLELTAFPTFFPLSEKFMKEKGDKYGLEADALIFNGPFTLSEWKHEQSFQFKKNDSYWDKATVKLDAINFDIVKDVSSVVNLYETGKVDRAYISSGFVDKFKNSAEYHTEQDARVYFLRLNQSDSPVMQNANARMAINLAFDKEGIASNILNNGSKAAYGLVPSGFAKGPSGKDFREENTDLNKYDVEKAKELWATAKKEMGKDAVKIEFLNYDDEDNKKIGEYIKEQLEKNLAGLTVEIKQQPYKQKLDLEKKLQYEMSLARWGPDYPDPMTYMDLFTTQSSFNEMKYSNPKYDDLVKKASTELLVDPAARWKAIQDAEKILFQDAAIAPVYQLGKAYVEKPYVKGIAKHSTGGDYSYKWATVEK